VYSFCTASVSRSLPVFRGSSVLDQGRRMLAALRPCWALDFILAQTSTTAPRAASQRRLPSHVLSYQASYQRRQP